MSTSQPKFERSLDPATKETFRLYPAIGSCSIGTDCVECILQSRRVSQQTCRHFIYDRALSIADAKITMDALKKNIGEDFLHLCEKVKGNGNSIMKRWVKKSKDDRMRTLQRAYPEISQEQWIVPAINYGKVKINSLREVRNSFLAPWLNIPTLVSDPNKLLALLHARTMFSPESWVSFDEEQTSFGWYQGTLAVDYADCCVALHGSQYGDIVSFDEHKAHRWDICAYPRAKLILEAQSLIMGFLKNTVDDLLQDINGPGSSVKFDEMANSEFRRCIGDEAWTRFCNQPFSDPTFDMDYLVGIAESRYAETMDHLWLLQPDVAYLQYHIKASGDGDRYRKSVLEYSKTCKFSLISGQVWTDPFNRTVIWKSILGEICHAREVYDMYRNVLQQGKALPKPLDEVLGCLESFISSSVQFQTKRLLHLLTRLEAFQHHFTYDSRQPHNIVVEYQNDNGCEYNDSRFFNKDPIFWAIHMLSAHDFELDKTVNLAMLFQFLSTQLSVASIQEKLPVEQRLYNELSTLASAHELLSAIRRFRPKCSPKPPARAKELSSTRLAWRMTNYEFEKRPYPIELLREGQIAFDKLVSSPFPRGARDTRWLQRATEVRQLSSQFWSQALEFRRWEEEGTAGVSLTPEDKEEIGCLLAMDSSPQHLAALEAERLAILSPKPNLKPRFSDS
ncbi:hypothetical protein VTL71DRAFT_15608 [Oculimacula yallundae]|uniref:Uncharacterized protein n=1 Tax=Oculimacula yallundae TaxID=86028 RepID=A0ABR4CH45_9HELO